MRGGPRATVRPATHCTRTAREKLVGPRAGLAHKWWFKCNFWWNYWVFLAVYWLANEKEGRWWISQCQSVFFREVPQIGAADDVFPGLFDCQPMIRTFSLIAHALVDHFGPVGCFCFCFSNVLAARLIARTDFFIFSVFGFYYDVKGKLIKLDFLTGYMRRCVRSVIVHWLYLDRHSFNGNQFHCMMVGLHFKLECWTIIYSRLLQWY